MASGPASLLLLLLAGLQSQPQPAASELPSASKGGTAYAVLPGRLLAAQTAARPSLSPDGRWAAFELDPRPRAWMEAGSLAGLFPPPPKGSLQVVVASCDTGQASGRFTLPPGALSWSLHWFARSGRALLLVAQEDPDGRTSHLMVPWNSRDGFGQPLPLSQEEGGQALAVYPSPSQPYAVLLGQRVEFGPDGLVAREEWRLMRVSDEGRLAQSQVFGRDTSGPRGHYWTEEGRSLHLPVLRHGGAPAVARIDAERLELSLSSAPSQIPAPEEPPFELKRQASGWLIQGEGPPSAILAPPQASALVSANCSRILVLYQGALFVHDVAPLSLSALAQAVYRQARDLAERKARDVGRSLRSYWAENFMHYPPQSRAAELLSPYLRSLESLEGLEVSYPGGPLSAGINTAATPFGWIRTRFGRAVIMLDGTVAWSEGSS